MAFLQQGRSTLGSKWRRRRRKPGSTVLAVVAGLIMIGMFSILCRLGRRRARYAGAGDETSSAVVANLDIIIDARQATRSGSASWLPNALCLPARLGVFTRSPGSATILVNDHAAAAWINSDSWLGDAARAGNADGGRRAAAAAMAAGRGFLLAPASALWTQDLRDALFLRTASNATDRPGAHVDFTCDVAMGGHETSVFGVRPTRGGRRFVEAAMQCEAAQAAAAPGGRKSGPAGLVLAPLAQPDARPPIFSHACLRAAVDSTAPDVRVCDLTHPAFQMPLDAFGKRGPAKTGLWPAAVVTEPGVSAGDLQAHGLWTLAPDGTCPVSLSRKPQSIAAAPPPPPSSRRIRVLTMARPASLRRLLDSLLAADFLGDTVSLDLVVDAPSGGDAADAVAAVAAHARTVAMVTDFKWPHGPVAVDRAVTQRGLTNQWLTWHPDRDDEACLVLEDDIQVAPTFYAWAKPRLAAYWAGAARGGGDDLLTSRLSAISLSLQNKVVGEVDGVQVYGKTDIGRLLGDGAPPAYLAAQVSSWAPILLPRPWRHFVSWWEGQRTHLPTRRHLNGSQVALSPCLPGLASNQWWAKAPDAMWTVWWHRFATVTGYVVLYQDPRAGPAQAVNHKEPGEHFKVKQSVDGALPQGTDGFTRDGSDIDLPDLAALPVYDLHMRPLGPAGGCGLQTLALRGDFVAHAPAFGGSCEWVGMTKWQRQWLHREEGTKAAAAAIGSPTQHESSAP